MVQTSPPSSSRARGSRACSKMVGRLATRASRWSTRDGNRLVGVVAREDVMQAPAPGRAPASAPGRRGAGVVSTTGPSPSTGPAKFGSGRQAGDHRPPGARAPVRTLHIRQMVDRANAHARLRSRSARRRGRDSAGAAPSARAPRYSQRVCSVNALSVGQAHETCLRCGRGVVAPTTGLTRRRGETGGEKSRDLLIEDLRGLQLNPCVPPGIFTSFARESRPR